MNCIEKIYHFLLDSYGPQGWWPLLEVQGSNPTFTGTITGYHIGGYDYPVDRNQCFEIWVGAILTQNTAWMQVEKALVNLQAAKLLDPDQIVDLNKEVIREAIRPAGYFNQKTGYLCEAAAVFRSLCESIPTRKQLLEVRGIGEETADCILLYAYHQCEFVIDAYTRRILSSLSIIKGDEKYRMIKELFEANLEQNPILFQEFHALLVEHAKRHYSKKPWGISDTLPDILANEEH